MLLIVVAACGDAPAGDPSPTPTTVTSTTTDTPTPTATSAPPTTATALTSSTTTPETSAGSARPQGADTAATSMLEALSAEPFPMDGIPDHPIPLEFELRQSTPMGDGHVVVFAAVPSTGTGVDVRYFLGVPLPDELRVALPLIFGETTDQVLFPLEGGGFDQGVFPESHCMSYTRPEGLSGAVCGVQNASDVILVMSELLLFERGDSNETMAAEMLAVAVDHYSALQHGLTDG
jgi:hypothetical protein